MPIYKCLRCGYEQSIKKTFKLHLKRKFKCKPKLKDISREEVFDQYFGEPKKPVVKEKKYSCCHCNKKFTSRQGRWVHEKKRCKGKLLREKILEQFELQKILIEQKKQEGYTDEQIHELIGPTDIATQWIESNL